MMPLFSSLNVLTSHLKAVIKWKTLKTSISAAVIKGWMDWRQMEHEVNLKVHQPYLLYYTTTSVRALNFLTQDLLFFPIRKRTKTCWRRKKAPAQRAHKSHQHCVESSHFYLYRAFKKTTGVNPKCWVMSAGLKAGRMGVKAAHE